jgi:hypothetical protein
MLPLHSHRLPDTVLNGHVKKIPFALSNTWGYYNIETVHVPSQCNCLDGQIEEMDVVQNSTWPGALALRCQMHFSNHCSLIILYYNDKAEYMYAISKLINQHWQKCQY